LIGCRRIYLWLAMLLIVLPGAGRGAIGWSGPSAGFAQEVTSTPTEDPAPSVKPAPTVDPALELDEEKSQPPTILTMIFGGNVLGLTIVGLILLLSVVSVYFIIEHFLMITRRRLMPDSVLDELERLIVHGEVSKAIELCNQKQNYSMATEVVLAGLNRYKSSEFGFAEYRSAVEEAGEDQTGKLYRRTEVLNVIGAIAPMLGLTGTVVGMIEAFTTIASLEGMARPQELAGGIGQALITTLLGLVVAIPTMVAFSFFRNKIDSLVAEAGKRIERVMMPLGRKKSSPKVTK
jgi:biopolymer transport protein ExbB